MILSFQNKSFKVHLWDLSQPQMGWAWCPLSWGKIILSTFTSLMPPAGISGHQGHGQAGLWAGWWDCSGVSRLITFGSEMICLLSEKPPFPDKWKGHNKHSFTVFSLTFLPSFAKTAYFREGLQQTKIADFSSVYFKVWYLLWDLLVHWFPLQHLSLPIS